LGKKFYLLLLAVVFSLGAFAQRDPGTQDPSVKILKFFPNPATNFITFEFQRSFDKGYVLQIFNFPGKKVAEAPLISSKVTIRLDNFYRGIYLFRLIDRNGRVAESGKFQVTK
jgi:hypothetical protein